MSQKKQDIKWVLLSTGRLKTLSQGPCSPLEKRYKKSGDTTQQRGKSLSHLISCTAEVVWRLFLFQHVDSHKQALFTLQMYFIVGLWDSSLCCRIWSQRASHQFFNISKVHKHSSPMYKSWWTMYYDSAPRFYKEAYYPSKLWKLETKGLQYENCQSVSNSIRRSPNRIRNAPYDPLPYSFPFLKTQDWVITKNLYENLAPMKVSCINDVWHSQAITVRNIQPPCL